MELSSTSWHSKLYMFTYNSSLPISLCPYFWKLVLAIVLFIPLTVFYIPLIIGRLLIEYSYFRYPTYFNKNDFKMALFADCLIWDIYIVIKNFLYKEWMVLL